MKTVIMLVLLLTTLGVFGQLPDAPQPQPTLDFNTIVHNTPSTFKPEGRGRGKLIVFAAFEAFAIGADIYDVRASERDFKRGYVETHTFLLCSEKQEPSCRPSAPQLYARDIAFDLAIASTPAILGYIFKRPEFFYAGLTAPAVYGIKRLQGGYRAAHLK